MANQLADITDRILAVRGRQVILDGDLATLYGVETKALNRAVQRNEARFPADFSFKLSVAEWNHLRCQIGTSSSTHGGRRVPPRAFTEHGALMASTVLRSEQATTMSVFIIRAFVKMREESATNQEILRRLAKIDGTLLRHNSALRDLYQKLLPLLNPPPNPPRPQIGFRPDQG